MELPAEEKAPEVSPTAATSVGQRLLAMLRVLVTFPRLLLTIIENQNQIARALQTSTAVLNQLNARVYWYEQRVPFIRKEYFAFLEHEKAMLAKAQAAIDYEERERRRANNGAEPKLEMVPP